MRQFSSSVFFGQSNQQDQSRNINPSTMKPTPVITHQQLSFKLGNVHLTVKKKLHNLNISTNHWTNNIHQKNPQKTLYSIHLIRISFPKTKIFFAPENWQSQTRNFIVLTIAFQGLLYRVGGFTHLKNISSNSKSSPRRGETKQYLKPQPSYSTTFPTLSPSTFASPQDQEKNRSPPPLPKDSKMKLHSKLTAIPRQPGMEKLNAPRGDPGTQNLKTINHQVTVKADKAEPFPVEK